MTSAAARGGALAADHRRRPRRLHPRPRRTRSSSASSAARASERSRRATFRWPSRSEPTARRPSRHRSRIASAAGASVFATGGIGGVHRDAPFDESADLDELARTPMVVVCAGAKSILDLAATLERLETLGVTVVGYGTDELPGFFTRTTGLRLPARADSRRGDRRHPSGGASARPIAGDARRPAAAGRRRPRRRDGGPGGRPGARRSASQRTSVAPRSPPSCSPRSSGRPDGRSLAANLGLLEENAVPGRRDRDRAGARCPGLRNPRPTLCNLFVGESSRR